MGEHDFPSKKEVQRHWNAQEPSVFRPPYSRDKGHSIVNSATEVRGVLEMEISGQPVELFKTRSPATNYPDPIADAKALIQWYHTGITAEEFTTKVKSPIEHLLYLILYGKMSDHQRATNLGKLSKLINDEQKRLEDKVHREKEIELKRSNNVLKGLALQEQMRNNEQKRQRIADEAAKESDVE